MPTHATAARLLKRRVRVAASVLALTATPFLAGCGASSSNPAPVPSPVGTCAAQAMRGPYWVNGPIRHLRDRDGGRTVDDCVTVRGKVMSTKHELDGDMHIKLLLDPQYRSLLAPGNLYQDVPDRCGFSGRPAPGCIENLMVVEIIPQHCDGIYPYSDNCADRGGFVDPPYPKAGDYVEVTGFAVRDFDPAHHDILRYPSAADGWAEIHPATGLRVLAPGPAGYPNPPMGPSDVGR